RYEPGQNRYPRYAEQVAASPQVAYITAKSSHLDQRLRDQFAVLGVSYTEKAIGVYRIFHDLSRPVRPFELKLGEVTP
ncbi:MAG: hypothetical protein U9Q82_16355, partial [Chloroflexota bacterium]|nr:hypothetical protein [Chloroflexota bacterium]